MTDKPDSPHLLAPKIKARMYFGIASNDDERQPDAKDKLKEAFAAAKVPAEIEVYSARMAGACRICPSATACPSITRPRPSVPGRNSSPYIKWLWHRRYPTQLWRPINPKTGCTGNSPPSQSIELLDQFLRSNSISR